jgi:acyl carrier protein
MNIYQDLTFTLNLSDIDQSEYFTILKYIKSKSIDRINTYTYTDDGTDLTSSQSEFVKKFTNFKMLEIQKDIDDKAEDLFQLIRRLVAEQIGIPEDGISVDTSLKDIGFDSLDEFELKLAIEDMGDMDIDDGDISHIKTISDIMKYLQDRYTL